MKPLKRGIGKPSNDPSSALRLVVMAILCQSFVFISQSMAQPPPGQSPSTAAVDSPTAQDLEALAAKIESKQGREELLSQIRALIALQRQQAETAPERPISERLTETVSRTLEDTYRNLIAIGRQIPDRQVLADWFEENIFAPHTLTRWSSQAPPIVLILALAWISEFIVDRLLAGTRRRLRDRAAETEKISFALALARTALRLCALAVFAIVAFGACFFLRPGPPVRGIAIQLFLVYLSGRLLVILTRTALAPASPSLRLVTLGNESAQIWFAWIRRLIVVGLAGFLMAGTALLFGLSIEGFSYLMDILGLVLVVMLMVCILRNRRAVAAWIRGTQEGAPASGSLRHRARSALAAVWHFLAILYLIAAYVIWWRNIRGGFAYLARATLLTVLLFVAARLAIHAFSRGFVRRLVSSPLLRETFPILAKRFAYYAPATLWIVRTSVGIVAGVAILKAWKVDTMRWLAEPWARQLLTFLLSMLLVAVIAVVIWETVNIATEHYLARAEKREHTPQHSARVRTLLPLARKVLLIALSVMVLMFVLSEIGLNIGPLLAGAGIIGLAVGFGAQKLVQDIITGIFILLEDAVSVGDVVNVAGIGGLVEDLSIRSIRLRDLSGNVHTIPFSSVGTVTNMTRLYSYYVADIGVAYREDTDKVAEVCRQIVDEMRSDPKHGPQILEPLEVLGVDQFADSAVIIKARIKTRPIQQWMVGREFNRRMKKRFDELGIEIPFPHRTLYWGAAKDGSCAALKVTSKKNTEFKGR